MRILIGFIIGIFACMVLFKLVFMTAKLIFAIAFTLCLVGVGVLSYWLIRLFKKEE
jgi:hypothetical protein